MLEVAPASSRDFVNEMSDEKPHVWKKSGFYFRRARKRANDPTAASRVRFDKMFEEKPHVWKKKKTTNCIRKGCRHNVADYRRDKYTTVHWCGYDNIGTRPFLKQNLKTRVEWGHVVIRQVTSGTNQGRQTGHVSPSVEIWKMELRGYEVKEGMG